MASYEHPFRRFALLATAIAVPLNLATTIVSVIHERDEYGYWIGSSRSVTTFCFVFVPLTMTVLASIASLRNMKKHSKVLTGLKLKLFDLVSMFTYLGVLIPIWVVEVQRMNRSGLGLLIGYTTAPLIVNLFLHMYFTVNHLPWKQFFSKISSGSSSCQQCPNCQQKFITGTPQTKAKNGYSILRGEDYLEEDTDADAVGYTDARESEDLLSGVAEQAEHSKQPEGSGRGKAMVEV